MAIPDVCVLPYGGMGVFWCFRGAVVAWRMGRYGKHLRGCKQYKQTKQRSLACFYYYVLRRFQPRSGTRAYHTCVPQAKTGTTAVLLVHRTHSTNTNQKVSGRVVVVFCAMCERKLTVPRPNSNKCVFDEGGQIAQTWYFCRRNLVTANFSSHLPGNGRSIWPQNGTK